MSPTPELISVAAPSVLPPTLKERQLVELLFRSLLASRAAEVKAIASCLRRSFSSVELARSSYLNG